MGPDGKPDNPGVVVMGKPVRTDYHANQSLNIGLSATLSIPMNKKLQKQCMEAAQLQNDMQGQLIANKRLDFETCKTQELWRINQDWHYVSPQITILFYMC